MQWINARHKGLPPVSVPHGRVPEPVQFHVDTILLTASTTSGMKAPTIRAFDAVGP